MRNEILKIDPDQRLVYGFASVIEENGAPVIDSQGDVISEQELQKAAHGFLTDSRKAGEMHRKTVGTVVESIVLTKSTQAALGVNLGKVGWFITMKIDDEAVWQRVKKGELSSFSIHGVARRVEI